MNVVALEALDKLKPAVQHLIDELKIKQDSTGTLVPDHCRMPFH